MSLADGADDGWIGRVIDGRYLVQALVGTGGMGVVYRVEHVRLRKIAAMKVLHRELASNPGAMRRFRREVEVVSRLDHPNIVQTFDSGHVDGQLYLVMEYVRGEDLGTVVRRDGCLRAPRALALAIQVCAALEEAHERGIVHCDLKPDNIVCARRRQREEAKVLDFGLASLREGPEPGEVTQSILLGGTPSYMSPEQVKFETIDARSDLYSLGATLYQLVTGAAAFEASTPIEVMSRHLTDTLVPPSRRAPALRLPEALDRVVVRAMARRREDRYPSAAEMRLELEAALAQIAPERRAPLPAAPTTEDGLARLEREEFDAFERQLRRRRLLGTVLGAPLVVGGLVFAGWAALNLPRPEPVTEEREPNDRPALAGLLPRGRAVRGRIGASGASGQPDLDDYRIPPGPGPRAVSARVTGVRDRDLVLELYDQQGRLVIRANTGRAGEDEWLGPAAIGAGEGFVRVRPVWTAGRYASAEASAPYELTVDWAPPRQDWELEPNDAPAAANRVDPPRAIEGRLATVGDEDWFRVQVPPGSRLVGRVDGIDGIDLVVLVGQERRRLDQNRAGAHESIALPPGADGTVLIGISERRHRHRPRSETDDTYKLRLKLRPQPPPKRS